LRENNFQKFTNFFTRSVMSSHFTLSVLTKAEKNQDGSFVFPFSANTVTFLFFYGGREF